MRLYLMRLGRMRFYNAPIPSYLIQLDDGTNILVDSGYSRTRIDAYRTHEDETICIDEQDYVLNQLALLGLDANAINYVICTHLDPDHAGNHDVFPNAEFVIQRSHYKAALQDTIERLKIARSAWGAPALHYRQVDGDIQLLPSVELIESSGHIVGHQSVLVRLPQTGPVLLAIDAIPFASQLDPETRLISPSDLDPAKTRESTRKLVDLAQREHVALIVHGHDPQQWAQLKQLPDFYA